MRGVKWDRRVRADSLKTPANFVPHFLGSLQATVTALARTCITIAWNAFPTARIPKIRPQSRVRKFAYRKAHFFSGAAAALSAVADGTARQRRHLPSDSSGSSGKGSPEGGIGAFALLLF